MLKRTLDLCVALGAVLLLLPVLAAVAAAVRFSSPGPVLYRARRVGRHGHHFAMLKFRTMHQGVPDLRNADGSTFNAVGDPRVTGVGEWLRKTSLDELPQLWNIVRGEMSLVGPRPDLPDQLAFYAPEDHERLKVRPGITGLAQVGGRNRLTWKQRRALDTDYVARRTMALDLSILLRTLPAVLFGRDIHTVTHDEPHDRTRLG
ncbi:MAG TPA: sugar transferase [Gemmatimonadaceae bacterium]|nr:sugar transferase [Gemmatimonadaceae bacterium]